MAQKGTDIGEVKANNRRDQPKIADQVNVAKFTDGKYMTFRLFGPTFSYATYWVKPPPQKDSKGGNKSRNNFPIASPSYDPATQEFDSTIYDPWRDLMESDLVTGEKERDNKIITSDRKYYICAISRNLQRSEPVKKVKPTREERETGFKDKDSDSWSPVVVIPMGISLVTKIKELQQLNTVESKSGATKAFPVTHEKYGIDIRILYDSTKPPANKYEVQLGKEQTPLTEEELAYLTWDLSELQTPADEKETRRNFEGWAKRMGLKTTKKRKHDVEDFDEDEDDVGIDADEDEDDEDEAPARKKKVAAKKTTKKKVVEEDEDDFDEDEEDEDSEDEDDEPPKRGRKVAAKKAPAKKKRVVDEDEEDEDEDSEDDDFDEDEDEEDEPPKRGKKTVAKKVAAKKTTKRKVVEEDEDEDEEDDFDEDEEDEDDEPVAKKKKPAAKKTTKRKVVEEDEEDEDEDSEDEDEDEEDEPPERKKKPAAKKVAAKKARR